jgi:phosphoribosylamine---glycine ligase
MNILILGSGGREHALAWKIAQSERCDQLYIAPGNAGTQAVGTNLVMDIMDFDRVRLFCVEHQVDLVIVGPEAPLVAGITDSFRNDPTTSHIHVIGPSAHAAQLEGSKAFAKKFMQKYDIPTAAYLEVTKENIDIGFAFLESRPTPYVLKADGLAAGKGVLIIDNVDEAKSELLAMIDGKFGSASSTVVIEQFLEGIEFSVFALTDGRAAIILPEAKDYKRVGEGDSGLNTGGMGAISPVPFVDSILWQKVNERIIKPTIDGLSKENFDYTGFVFFGLICCGGEPYVIEYNCRLGDPETEVVIPRIKSDLVDVLYRVASGDISTITLEIDQKSAAAIMLVSGGYPGDFQKGFPIETPSESQSLIFHAGTAMREGQVVTNGGRVIAVTSMHDDFKIALKNSKEVADKIQYQDKYYRSDIGFDL